jgi:hypothetical protein
MSLFEGLIDLVAIGIPEIAGEFVTNLFLRGGRGRWQRVASGDRRRAEAAVRSLRRNHVSAWIHPAPRGSYEVVVRTSQAEAARELLNAPSSGRIW